MTFTLNSWSTCFHCGATSSVPKWWVCQKQVDTINRAAETLLNLQDSWENATKEEQRELVHLMLQEVGCSIPERQVIWVKPRQKIEIFLSW